MSTPKKLSAVFLAFFFLVSLASAQHQLEGVVTDTEGKPLAGVTVLVKGTKRGTTTDQNGRYSLAQIAPDATLVFSRVGYKKMEVAVEGKTQINMALEEGLELGEFTVVGTRRMDRSVTETPVAIDILDVKELSTYQGQIDLNQMLQSTAPSFNASRQSGADGADHIDPATLRGLGPDQTLVLVNGKRRHQSSHVNIFGTRGRGNTGTDLNAIPPSAIERIEILRDGASAQYGSDAIAGVVNVVLKSSVNELTGSVTTGTHQARFRADRTYDGEETHVGANYGLPAGDAGFINMSMDYVKKEKTNRPADPNRFDIYRRQFGDASLENFGAFVNSSFSAGEQSSVYAFGGFNFRHTDAYAWTRHPGSERNVLAIYPNGFDPRITSNITDPSFSIGLRSTIQKWSLDINNTYGLNRFHYIIDGTLNPTLLEQSPTRFDAGGFQLSQNTTGINLTRFFSDAFAGVNVALGVEYRVENYEIFAGEEGSWRNYRPIIFSIDTVAGDTTYRPGGSQGFPGFRPENELDEIRTNLGAYVDAEFDFTNQWMVGGALRFENYSDFGKTLNAKLTSRYKLTDRLAIRGSASTGFRAPSLAQIYFNSVFTDFVAGVPVDKIIAKNNSPITRTLGILSLKEEKARNVSLGFTASPFEGFTATLDGYYVEIEDRIVLTGAFEDTDPDIGASLQALNVGAAQFFTNAVDTRTRGVDVILTYTRSFDDHRLKLSYAGNFNEMSLGAIKTSPKLAAKQDIYFGRREKHFLIASAPRNKMSLTIDYGFDRIHGVLRLVHFGKVTLIDWLDQEDVYKPMTVTDFSVGYDLTSNVSLVVGAANVLNVYPTEQDTETETGGIFDAVQGGFSGRFYFTKLHFRL